MWQLYLLAHCRRCMCMWVALDRQDHMPAVVTTAVADASVLAAERGGCADVALVPGLPWSDRQIAMHADWKLAAAGLVGGERLALVKRLALFGAKTGSVRHGPLPPQNRAMGTTLPER